MKRNIFLLLQCILNSPRCESKLKDLTEAAINGSLLIILVDRYTQTASNLACLREVVCLPQLYSNQVTLVTVLLDRTEGQLQYWNSQLY
jgi:hypothetical protein